MNAETPVTTTANTKVAAVLRVVGTMSVFDVIPDEIINDKLINKSQPPALHNYNKGLRSRNRVFYPYS